jgi:hypothetical protein
MKKTVSAGLAIISVALCSSAMGQSAGSLISTMGGTWLDFGSSSATSLRSSSAAGVFRSSGQDKRDDRLRRGQRSDGVVQQDADHGRSMDRVRGDWVPVLIVRFA